MTTGGDQGGRKPRARRHEPTRDAPLRGGWTRAPAAAAAPGNDAVIEADIDKVVADAVRLGYEVIGENLRQGRVAADRFSAGQYGVKDIPDDMAAVGGRLLQLMRDLGTTWFDLIHAVVRDPKLREVLQPQPIAPVTPGGSKPPVTPPTGTAPIAPFMPIPLACIVRGNVVASAAPTVLLQPAAPAMLSLAGLYSPDRTLPPITRVAFTAAADGGGVVAIVTIPDDQPAGTYSGVIADAVAHTPLGTLTVRVGA